MARSKLKIVGFTIAISWIMFIALMFFINSLRVLWADWFSNNALIIAIISGVVVGIGIITGAISLGALTSKSKGFLG